MTREVVAVGASTRRREQWADVPASLYEGLRAWVPPLRRDVLAQLDPARNPLHRHAEIEHFLLLDDGRPVGRVAATALHAAEPGVGYFGFLDSVPDDDAVGRLLGAAETWLAARGRTRCAGPYNYFSGQEMGMLENAFDERPAVFQTWNPATTPKLVAACGYEVTARTASYRVPVAALGEAAPVLERTAARTREQLGVSTRPVGRGRRFARDMERIRLAFNASFATSPENVPYEPDVFHAMVSELRPFVDRELVRLCERDGETVGFALTVPDVNPLLAELGGRLRPIDLLRIPRLRRGLRTAVVLVVGTVPGTPLGVGHVLFADTAAALRAGGYDTVETTWVHHDNRALNGLMQGLFRARPHREFALYGRDLR